MNLASTHTAVSCLVFNEKWYEQILRLKLSI